MTDPDAGLRVGILPFVVDPRERAVSSSVKRAALMFDRLRTRRVDSFLGLLASRERAEVERLIDTGVLASSEMPVRSVLSPINKARSDRADWLDRLGMRGVNTSEVELYDGQDSRSAHISSFLEGATIEARVIASHLWQSLGTNATALLPEGPVVGPLEGASNAVIRIVIDALPQLDDSTPWDSILQFRSDADVQAAYFRLLVWMNQIARESRPDHEIADELRMLLSEYERHMRRHKQAIRRGAIEAIVVPAAEVLEDIAHLRFAKVLKGLFSLSAGRTELAEAESGAPGREVAYIVHARAQLM